jgi:hypothetical protein
MKNCDQDNQSLGLVSNQRFPEYETGVLTIMPRYSVFAYFAISEILTVSAHARCGY